MNARVIIFINFLEADERRRNVTPAIVENFYRDGSFAEVAENFFNRKFFFGRSRRNEYVDRAGNVQQKFFQLVGKFGVENVNDCRNSKIDGRRVKIKRNFQRKIFLALELNEIFKLTHPHKISVAQILTTRPVPKMIENKIIERGIIHRTKILERAHKIFPDKTPQGAVKAHE